MARRWATNSRQRYSGHVARLAMLDSSSLPQRPSNKSIYFMLLNATSLILTSLPTVNITPLKLLCYYIHDHLINAIGSRQISCLCLLDLSAAFDITDHNILLTRLSSWFGIQGTALNWFRSYLSSRCFRVKCNNNLSSLHTCRCGVLQRLVLGPLLCHVCNPTQYSHLISVLKSSLVCWRHTTLPSFHPAKLHSNITHLQNAQQQITFWVTANLISQLF